MSTSQQLISGTLWLSTMSYSRFILNFGVQLLLVRLLVPEDFGLFAVVAGTVELLFVFSLFTKLVVQHYQQQANSLVTAYYMAWGSSLSLILLLTPLFIWTQVTDNYRQFAMIFFCLMIAKALYFPTNIRQVCLEKNFAYKVIALATILSAILSALSATAAALMGLGIWALIIKESLDAVAYFTCIHAATLRLMKGRFDRSQVGELLRYGLKQFLSNITDVLTRRLPNILLTHWAGYGINGLYDRAYYLTRAQRTLLTPLTHQISTAIYAKFREDNAKMNATMHWSLFINFRWGLLIAPPCYFMSETILAFLFGEQWRVAGSYLSALILWLVTLPATDAMRSYLAVLNQLSLITQTNILILVTTLIGFAISMYTGQWHYIAWGLGTGSLLRLLLYMFRVDKQLAISWRQVALSPLLITAVAMQLFFWLPSLSSLTTVIAYALLWLLLTLLFEQRQLLQLIALVRGKEI